MQGMGIPKNVSEDLVLPKGDGETSVTNGREEKGHDHAAESDSGSTVSSNSDLTAFLQRSFNQDETQFKKWMTWFELNMPLCYVERVCQASQAGLHRVHLRALGSFCGPNNNDTTTVVRHKEENGFIVSVLESQSNPGTLLNIIRNTLPQATATLYCIEVFTSLDDCLALSVYHYYNIRDKVEKPSDDDKRPIFDFAVDMKQDHTQKLLDTWLQGCPAYFVRYTHPRRVLNLFRFCCMSADKQLAVVEWELDEAEAMKYDMPIRDCAVESSTEARERKKEKLASAFWISACVPSVPTIVVMEIACSVLLDCKLNIERAHADTVDMKGTTYVLVSFFVFPHEDSARDSSHIANSATETLCRDLSLAMTGRRKSFDTIPLSPSRSSEDSGDLSSANSVEGISPRQSVTISGYLQKQRQLGMIKLWHKRWFELSGLHLSYSNSPSASIYKSFDLSNFRLTDCSTRKFAFCLSEKQGKVTLRLACASDEEQSRWWQSIVKAQKEKAVGVFKQPEPIVAPCPDSIDTCDGRQVLSRYQRLTFVDRGTTGKLWKVRDKDTGEILAMKVMDKEQIMKANMERPVMAEKGILQNVRHPFVIQLHSAFQTNTKLCLILEFHSGGTLQNLIDKFGRVPESICRFYAAEMALALRYLHRHNIIHRDMKLSNVLISGEGHAIVTDFGLATSSPEAHTFCGTPQYLAPEVLEHKAYTNAVDWWCYGVILYHLLTNKLPFVPSQGQSLGATMYRNILDEEPQFEEEHLSPNAVSLLKGLMEKNPDQRLGVDQIMSHPFFENVDWDAMEKLNIASPYIPDSGL